MSVPAITPVGHSGPKIPKLAPHLSEIEDLDEEDVTFAVAHDGSRGAKACLDLAFKHFFVKKAKAYLEVVHIFDSVAQGDLMRAFRKDSIEAEVRALDISHGSRFTLQMIPKVPGEKEGKTLCEWMCKQEAAGACVDFMLMGFKGAKNAAEEVLLASDVSYCLAFSRCSMIVLRDWTPPEDPAANLHYLVPVDLTKWSEKALHDALLLSSPGDKITVLRICFDDEKSDAGQMAKYFTKLIARIGKKFGEPRVVNLVEIRSGGQGVSEAILNYADKAGDVDFICMGTNVKRLQQQKSYLGSVSGAVLLAGRYPMVIARYDEDFESVVSHYSRPAIDFQLPTSFDGKIFKENCAS